MNKSVEESKVFEKSSIYKDDDSGKVFLIALLAPFIMAFLFSYVASAIAQGQEIESEVITSSIGYYIAFSICTLLLYVAIVIIYNKSKKISFKALHIDFKMKWQTYLLLISIGILSIFGIQYFIGAIDNFLKVVGYPLSSDLAGLNPTSWGKYVLAVVFLAIFPAIGEELIFRGVILHGLRSKFNDIVAVLLSALMFAIMHESLQQLVYPFILGCIMGWVVLRTGSLVSSIIIHFVNNFLVVTFAFIQNMTGFTFSLADTWWFYIVAIALLAITFGLYFIIDRYYFKHKSKELHEKSSEKTSIWVYISLGAGLILLVIASILTITLGKVG